MAYMRIITSDAGTNLIVGGSAPVRRKGPEIFFGCAPPFFGSKSTISRFGERFRDGLFAVLLIAVPRAHPFVKVRVTCPRALWSWRH